MGNKFSDQIKRGVKLFITITIISLVIIFLLSSKGTKKSELIYIFRNIELIYLLLALLLWIMGTCIDSLRIQLLVKGLGERVSFFTGIEVIISGIFLATVTPFQTGGLPVQMYIFHKKNISPGKAGLVLLFRGILQMGTTILAIPFIVIFFPSNNILITTLFYWVIIAITVGLTISFWIVFYPMPARRFFHRIGYWIWNKRGKKPRKYFLFISEIFKELRAFKEGLKTYLNCGKLMLLGSFLLTGFFLMFYYLIPAALMKGLGVENVPVLQTIVIQIILTFAFLFAPTPGGSGVAEIGFRQSFYSLFPSTMSPGAAVGLLTLVWRMITCFIPTILGAILTLRVLHLDREDIEIYQQKKD